MRPLMAYLVAALAGSTMAVQGAFNAILGNRVGSFQASFIVHVIGTVLLGMILLLGPGYASLGKIKEGPWYALLGGPLNVLIIWGVLSSVGRLGVAPATTAILFAQISTALLLDLAGLAGARISFTPLKALGAALFGLGAWLLLRQ
ncbi:MAG TPA: DMT family transporter [Firmicutes bacterium]|nr:DMT family transporter [Candidatus Fermentithermobacillaceae bacterium]